MSGCFVAATKGVTCHVASMTRSLSTLSQVTEKKLNRIIICEIESFVVRCRRLVADFINYTCCCSSVGLRYPAVPLYA